MKKILLIILLTISSHSLFATHIVGGEIELTHLNGNTYRLALILYFDAFNGNPGAIDDSATLSIFDTRNNDFLQSFNLPIVSNTFVNYSDPACAIGNLSTRRIYYEIDSIMLDPTVYNDELGYYASYERCCRNGVIQNIFDPGGAGQTFLLRFPPIIKNGQPFINSTPRLFPPLSDYACINTPFYFDFSGTDLDGDSLVYSLVTPLNGNSTRQDPLPNFPIAGPYSLVEFLNGFSEETMIQGDPSLGIEPSTGFITITPSELGLFVFAVRVEEFRDGEKLGEVRRDYQMLVIDCPPSDPPTLGFETANNQVFNDSESFSFDLNEEGDLCFDVFATDPNEETVLNTQIIPISHPDATVVEVQNLPRGAIEANEVVSFNVCLTECPEILNEDFSFQFLVGDNSCALPLWDTVDVTLNIALDNILPEVSTDLAFNSIEGYYEVNVQVGEPLNFTAIGTDADFDSLLLRAIGVDFNLSDVGINFSPVSGRAAISKDFDWIPTCETVDPETNEGTFFVDLILEDFWTCGKKSSDTTRVKVNIFFTPEENASPEIIIPDLPQSTNQPNYQIELQVGDSTSFEILADDTDGDLISVTAIPQGFNLAELGIDFGGLTGIAPQSAILSFDATCEMLGQDLENQEYIIDLVVRDESNCTLTGLDTVQISILIKDAEQPNAAEFPNTFTPNGDGSSETFRIPMLPLNDCKDQFQKIVIVNRWGEEVFTSEIRDFEWDGGDHPAGVYFYHIQYVNSEYKGTINMIRDEALNNN